MPCEGLFEGELYTHMGREIGRQREERGYRTHQLDEPLGSGLGRRVLPVQQRVGRAKRVCQHLRNHREGKKYS